MMIATLKIGLVGAIALAAMATTAMANSITIATDRVQVQVGNSGQIYLRTLADRPVPLSQVTGTQVTGAQVGSRLPTATFAPACTARSHSAHSTRSTAGGNVIYSENRSTTQVCQ